MKGAANLEAGSLFPHAFLQATRAFKPNMHGVRVLPERSPRTTNASMNQDYPIPSDQTELKNSTRSLSQVAYNVGQTLRKRYWPPLPPLEKAPPEDPAQAAVSENPPRSHSVTSSLASHLANDKPSLPRVPIDRLAFDPSNYTECAVALYARLFDESDGPIGFAHFDSDPELCSALVAELNRAHPKARSLLGKRYVESVERLAAQLFADVLLHAEQTPVVAAVRASILTTLGESPNARVTQNWFAGALAESSLLERVAALPIYGKSPVIGRKFLLSEVKIFVPNADLGHPWDDMSKGQR
jgi:hypothetical protein